jgi:predicted HTH transcriptional regulator
MTDTEEKQLFAACLGAMAEWLQDGGRLTFRLEQVLRAGQGDVVPGDPYQELVPDRHLDKVQRTKKAIELLRERGRLTSGELAKVSYCDPETARLTLSGMAARGVVRRLGEKKQSHYIPGPRFPALG